MIVSDLLMNDERYTLSNWKAQNIYVKTKEKALSKLVMDAVYNIRRILIDLKIADIKTNILSSEHRREELELVRDYTALKQLIYDKLARVV
jgi:DNA primase